MSNSAVRMQLRLDAVRRRSQTDDSGVAPNEAVAILAVVIIVAIAAVAVLDVAGVDVTGWMREQLGVAG